MADTANTNTNAWLPALKAAFPLTIPICLGFLFLGASYGILMGTKGFSFVWPMCMSAFIFAGSMEFVTVNLLLSAFNPLAGFLLALMVNARHLFYGLSMLGKFKGLGWKRPYLIFGMCDETFAINSTAKIPAGIDRGWFYFWVTLCNQLYWVTGATLGGLIGAHLPFNTDGLDFVMTVCTGNICRSPMGEIILRHFFNERGLGDQVNVESSGVSDEEWSHPIDPRAVRVLRERGYGDEIPRDHFAHRISREEIDRTDLFLPMTASHMRALLRMLPAGKRAEVHMYRSFDPNLPKPKPGREDQIDLVDPWYGGKHEFEVAIDQFEEVAPYIVDWVAKQL